MIVSITDAEIKKGWQDDDCRNPVALAIRGAVGIPTSAGPGMAVVDYATPWQTEVWLPEEVIDWLDAFDRGQKVGPIAFEFDFDVKEHERRRAGRK